MSFNNREVSRTQGNPISLLLFRYGSADPEYYAYTSHEQTVTNGLIDYLPVPMDLGKIEASGTLDKKTLEIRLPISTDIAEIFVLPPSYPVTLVIRRGHLNDPDNEFLVEWSGRVLSCSREGAEAVFACEPISTALRRSGLRRHYQYSCPHALYGPQCNANEAAATTTNETLSVDAAAVTLFDGWETPTRAAAALGGVVTWTGPHGTIIRTIIEVLPNLTTLKLNGPTTGLQDGDEVTVKLGCNHRFELTGPTTGVFVDTDCFTIHNNVPNYGGMPWIPLDNPIGTNVNKYY